MGANTSNDFNETKNDAKEENMFEHMNLETLGIDFNEITLQNNIAMSGGNGKIQMPVFGGKQYKNNYEKYNVSRALFEMENNNNTEMKGGASNEITQVLANELDYIMDGGFGCNCGKNNYKCDCNNKLENKNIKNNPLMPSNSFYLKGGNNELSATSTMIDFSQNGGNILSETSSMGGFSKNSNKYKEHNSLTSLSSEKSSSSLNENEEEDSLSNNKKKSGNKKQKKNNTDTEESDSASDTDSEINSTNKSNSTNDSDSVSDSESDNESDSKDSESNSESNSSNVSGEDGSNRNKLNNSYSSNNYSDNRMGGISIFPFNSTVSNNSLSDRSMRLLRRHI